MHSVHLCHPERSRARVGMGRCRRQRMRQQIIKFPAAIMSRQAESLAKEQLFAYFFPSFIVTSKDIIVYVTEKDLKGSKKVLVFNTYLSCTLIYIDMRAHLHFTENDQKTYVRGSF